MINFAPAIESNLNQTNYLEMRFKVGFVVGICLWLAACGSSEQQPKGYVSELTSDDSLTISLGQWELTRFHSDKLGMESAQYHDYNLLMIIVLITGSVVILANMIAQSISEAIDPRIREERGQMI